MNKRKQANLLIQTGTSNALKCSKGKSETLSHRSAKFWVCNFCWERGLDFATEVVFKNNQRADVVVKDWNIAIEILGTESTQDFANKTYPIPAVPISAMMSVLEIMEMMSDLEDTNGDGAEFYIKKNLQEIPKYKRMVLLKGISDLNE